MRPSLLRMMRMSGLRPSSSITIWVASTMVSILSVPVARLNFFSIISKRRTRVITCSGMVTLGNITMKLSGSCPLVFVRSVVRKISRVRTPLAFKSSVNGLMRMPMNGEIVLLFMPAASSFAAVTAVASSSSLGRLPKPSSKSILKSSTASVCSFLTILLYTE